MPIQRLNLGPEPRLEIAFCGGNLTVRSTQQQETCVESSVHSPVVNIGEASAAIDQLNGNCTIRMPARGSLRSGHVGGRLEVRDISGQVAVSSVGGDCSARHVGSLFISQDVGGMLQARYIANVVEIGRVRGICIARHVRSFSVREIGGVADIRHSQGSLNLGTVHNDLTLRDTEAPAQVGEVGGNFIGRNLFSDIHIGRVRGDVAVRSDFAPGTASSFTLDGHAYFRVPDTANIRFVISTAQEIRLGEGLKALPEGEFTVVTLGEGAATVHVSAKGTIRITARPYHEDMSNRLDWSINSELEARFAEITSRLDEHLANFEISLADMLLGDHLSEQIRRRVKRKLNAARRHVETAQRHVEQALESAQVTDDGLDLSFGLEGEPRKAASDQERLVVLRMLEEGKISVQEADQLLSALER